MLIKTIMKLFKEKGVDLTPEEVANLASQEPNTPTIDFSELKHNKEAIMQTVETFKSEINSMKENFSNELKALQEENKQLLTALASEKEQRENITKIQQERAEQERLRQIDILIDEAKKDGRIPVENVDLQEKYKKILQSDLETGKAILDGLTKAVTTEPKITVEKPKVVNPLDPMETYLSQFNIIDNNNNQ